MILFFLVLCLGGSPTLRADTGEPGWLAYGDLRGHFEPCGCDPTTDLGGVKRLGVVVERERAAHPGTWLFGLGNDVPTASEGPLKTPFLVWADARLAPTATLMNELELARLPELKALAAAKAATPPWPRYVLSNVRHEEQLRPLAAPQVDGAGVVVLGYVHPAAAAALVEPLSDALLSRWRRRLAGERAKYKVLLYSGPDAPLRRLAAAQLFDAIISSNTSPLATLPGTAERDEERRLVRLTRPAVVPMVPLGGQGLLRGGSRRFDEAKPLAELLKDLADCPSPAGTGGGTLIAPGRGCADPGAKPALLRPVKLVTWLDPASAPGDGPLKDVYDRYSEAARQAFLNAGAARAKDLKDSPYAGAQACASCHPQASQVYAGSAHAHAMATLVAKGKHEDPECVACHAVGAQAKGGFVSLAASPQLANVQCENCHGARLAHSRDPAHAPKPTTPAGAVCVTCHVGQHSPAFDFATYWPRIAH